MALIEVRVRMLSGLQWTCEVPTSGSISDAQAPAKLDLGGRRSSQHLIVAGSEVQARDPLSHFEQAELLDVTLLAERSCYWYGVHVPPKSCNGCAFCCRVACQRFDWRRHKSRCVGCHVNPDVAYETDTYVVVSSHM